VSLDPSLLLDGLNDAQREAVAAPLQPIRVLAGAGSGKTRVLVQRIAWLLSIEGASPYNILAVTFTNKAAMEMRDRVQRLLNQPVDNFWIGTFHGITHKLLRIHHEEAKLPKTFQILDSDDQLRTIKRVMRAMGVDDKRYTPRSAQHFINGHKDEGRRPKDIPLKSHDPNLQVWLSLYTAYEAACQQTGAVDFAELLLRTVELLDQNPDIQKHYQQRFQHILVDEFQDTNSIQYRLIKLLSGQQGSVFIVGDDDQSIYGWRGAKIENIHAFQEDYQDTETVRLEQNYRSSGNILKAANAVIDNNVQRLGKNLWTADGDGEPIVLYAARNDLEEARFVAEKVQLWVNAGNQRSDIAILYRSNAQSRAFEEVLIAMQIPYRVYGGLRFFERAEIKDSLAYLRLATHQDDDTAFDRVINTPTRGLGEKSVDTIRVYAKDNQCSLWQASVHLLQADGLSKRADTSLRAFLELILNLQKEIHSTQKLADVIDLINQKSGILTMYKDSKDPRAEDRVENLEELINAAASFHTEQGLDMEPPIVEFLANAALEAGEGQSSQWDDCVQLMTLHSAKGLEFPVVFLVGVEEGLFPSQRSESDPERLEEERRLAYVGITRAMEQLVISYTEKRYVHGKESYPLPSRFINEIPDDLMVAVRPTASYHQPRSPSYAPEPSPALNGISKGTYVEHPNFGAGVVQKIEGSGNKARALVSFEEGEKWLVLAYAKLNVL
jgi:DNA helicase-2/ATP-dependent DNA helicase PcrA